jgi:predicted alpha/beta-fold hydrolase
VQLFTPLVTNPHLLTLAAHFWPSGLDERRFPVERTLYRTEPDVQVLVDEQRPLREPLGQVVIVHGLEGSSTAHYMCGLADKALRAGLNVVLLNQRNCGGTEEISAGLYHSGLTNDPRHVIEHLRTVDRLPAIVVAGYSLGGNLAVKLAGEYGADAPRELLGIAAVSPIIEVAECVRALERRSNVLYEWNFVWNLKARIRRKHKAWPGRSVMGTIIAERRSVKETSIGTILFIPKPHFNEI